MGIDLICPLGNTSEYRFSLRHLFAARTNTRRFRHEY